MGNNIYSESVRKELERCVDKKECYLNEQGIKGNQVQTILETLSKQSTSLEHLYLHNNNSAFGDTGAKHISDFILHSNTLKAINLGHNGISRAGLLSFTSGLLLNTSIVAVGLAENLFGDAGCLDCLDSLVRNRRFLAVLDLNGNSIGDEGADGISKYLMINNCVLCTLYLHNNRIGNKGALLIRDALKKKSNLTTLTLDGNIIDDESILIDIKHYLERNKKKDSLLEEEEKEKEINNDPKMPKEEVDIDNIEKVQPEEDVYVSNGDEVQEKIILLKKVKDLNNKLKSKDMENKNMEKKLLNLENEKKILQQAIINEKKIFEKEKFTLNNELKQKEFEKNEIYKKEKLNAIEKKRIEMKDLALVKRIGQGAEGEVWEGLWNGSGGGIKVVLKCFKLAQEFDISLGDLNEYIALMSMSHPNVLTAFGYSVSDDKKDVRLVLEWMSEGDVNGFVKKNKLSAKEKAWIMREMCKSVHYLHEKEKVIHKDIKGANFLVNKIGERQWQIKISDFGFSVFSSLSAGGSSIKTTAELCGTFNYMAPELFDDGGSQTVFSRGSDVYALGMSFFEVIFDGIKPYESELRGKNFTNQFVFMKSCKGSLPPFPNLIPQDCDGLITIFKECVFFERKSRLSTQEILDRLCKLVE